VGARHAKYLEYQRNVCRELCTKYGKVDIFWWDAAWWGGMFTAEMWDAENLTRELRQLQPGILMNNRCSVPGDFDTPEQRLGFYQDGRPWESCMCLTHSWSYSGTPPKPRDQIIRMLVNNACCDGNLLLSWGPKWDGEFDAAEKDASARSRRVAEGMAAPFTARAAARGSGRPGAARPAAGRTAWLHVLVMGRRHAPAPRPCRDAPSCPRSCCPASRWTSRQAGAALTVTLPRARQTTPVTIVELTFDQSLDGLPAMSRPRAVSCLQRPGDLRPDRLPARPA
jgi:hypothetical protein